MKLLYYLNSLIVTMLLLQTTANAQITIGTSNMPAQGDTIRVSKTTTAFLTDPSITGFNTSWDYSSLDPASQEVLNFISPTNTPGIYQIIFNPFTTNLATPIPVLDFLDLQVSQAFAYFKNTQTEYSRVGFAANIMGMPIPMKYSQPERLYKFPLTENSTPDSTTSTITVQYPDVAYFNLLRKRVNSVDGSGTLMTPFGTFNTLRVKSVIYERDSLYLDSLSLGVPVIRNIIEYQWLSPDFPVPVLTITQEGTLYNIQYIDTVRNIIPLTLSLGQDRTICNGESVTLNATVAGGTPPYTYLWNTGETTSAITVAPSETMDYSVLVIDNKGNSTSASVTITVIPFQTINLGNDTTLCSNHSITFTIQGTYDNVTWFVNNFQKTTGQSFTVDSTGIGSNTAVIKVTYQNGECSSFDEVNITFHVCDALPEIIEGNLILTPNPADQVISINSTKFNFSNPTIRIANIAGSLVQPSEYSIANGRIELNIAELKKGIYFITILEKNHLLNGKFLKL
ncbi:MAG: T9SS type A sorting domain-containing protein [Omnitrophica WOR_2 bacterium]